MSMGSTGTVNMTPEMLRNALSVIDDYQKTLEDLHDQVDAVVAELIPANFSGNAAEGFKYFYSEKIEPATGNGATQLLEALRSMVEGILSAIPDAEGLDDQLADENKNV